MYIAVAKAVDSGLEKARMFLDIANTELDARKAENEEGTESIYCRSYNQLESEGKCSRGIPEQLWGEAFCGRNRA